MARRVEERSGVDTRRLATLARALSRTYRTGAWWPYDDPFSIAVSAVLTQQTRWAGVERAMEGLRRERLLTPRALAQAPRAEVERVLRPTGFFRQKARAVQGIARILVERFEGSFGRAMRLPTPELRKELLTWPGVGPETADSILLYAVGRPVFVIDAYTRRLMARFGALRPGATFSYDRLAAAWAEAVPGGAHAFRSMHGAIVEHCKVYCTRDPDCGACPLERRCPRVGILQPIGRHAAGSSPQVPP